MTQHHRSNLARMDLNEKEIALLELLRAPAALVEAGWDVLADRVHDGTGTGDIRADLLRAAVPGEHSCAVQEGFARLESAGPWARRRPRRIAARDVGAVRHCGVVRYFTSDTHYGHENIIRFCDRPYSDVHRMNVDLVNRAASLLSVEDELWHLGDVALGRLDDTLTHLAGIAVDVTLVAGNHDRCHPSNGSRGERFIDVYREKCRLRELILTNTRLRLTNGAEVQISHFPYADANPQPQIGRNGKLLTDKFTPWRPVDDGSWLLCGHIHEKWRQRGRMINVGVDAWGGQAVSAQSICALVDAGPRDLPPLPWR